MRKIILILTWALAIPFMKAGDWQFWTEDNYECVASVAKGNFSNALVKNHGMNSLVLFNHDKEGKLNMAFTLYEFGHYEVLLPQNEKEWQVKIKIGDSEQVAMAHLKTNEQDLVLGNEQAKAMADALRSGSDVEVEVELNYTTYHFTIEAAGFAPEFQRWGKS